MAKETIEADGKSYVLSKEAAKQTGYTQDYIGQLARSSDIDAKRLGGLWYVNLDSLTSHQKDSEAYVPTPPAAASARDTGEMQSIVSFDGQEYISSKRAAELVNYTQDYVGQLARGGKVRSKQQNGRWYIAKDDIRAHRAKKDALLAEVQAQSLGIRKEPSSADLTISQQQTGTATAPANTRSLTSEPKLLNYLHTEGSDLPILSKREEDTSSDHVSRHDISDSRIPSPYLPAARTIAPVQQGQVPRDAASRPGDPYDDEQEYPVAVHTMGRHAALSAVGRAEADQQRMASNGYTLRRSVWDVQRRDARAGQLRRKRQSRSLVGPILIFFCIIILAGSTGAYAAYLKPQKLQAAYDAASRSLGGTVTYAKDSSE